MEKIGFWHIVLGSGALVAVCYRIAKAASRTQPNLVSSSHNFVKLESLGNDFVVFDFRRTQNSADCHAASGPPFSAPQIRSICDRRRGVGGDQVLTLHEPGQVRIWKGNTNSTKQDRAVLRVGLRFWNVDGREAEACGNATRAVAAWLLETMDGVGETIIVETVAGPLRAWCSPGDPLLDSSVSNLASVCVDMGRARDKWHEIPLKAPCDTACVPLVAGPLHHPICLNFGNPLAVFFVPKLEDIDLGGGVGQAVETHSWFPKGTNVLIARVVNPRFVQALVWERSAGLTQACGTGACAIALAGVRRGILARGPQISVHFPGGILTLSVGPVGDERVHLSGPSRFVFRGQLDRSVLERVC